MPIKWYAASSTTPEEDSAIQAVPDPGDYTDLQDRDKCFLEIAGVVTPYEYDIDSSEAEDVPNIITPTGNSGDGRWVKITFESIDHEELVGLLGGASADHFHLTQAQHTDLTDGGDTTLHDHDGISENTTHRGSDGSDHDYIDQDVTDGSSPVLSGENFDEAEWDEQQTFAETAISSSSAAVAWDLSVAQTALHVMSEDTTISEPSNMKQGGTYIIRIQQAASWTLNWNAAFVWGEGVKSLEPAANGDEIIVSCYCTGSIMYATEFIREEA